MAELPAGDEWQKGTEESISVIRDCYCPNCNGYRGTTTMLPTKVPYFREIIVMSFSCDDCYYRNTEINFGGEIQPRGERITFKVQTPDDLNRQIIKSDSATVFIPACNELEIPPTTQKGNISTIEGFLRAAATNLEVLQPERLRLGDIDNFHRCRAVIEKLRKLAGVSENESEDEGETKDSNEDETVPTAKDNIFETFEIIIDDPAGNSFIENTHAPQADPALQSIKYDRTPKQDMSLGLQPSAEAVRAGTIDDSNPLHKNIANAGPNVEISPEIMTKNAKPSDSTDDDVAGIGRKEVIMFNTPCPHCFKTVETNMCVVDIPHFKEIIIMSLVCDHCGYKNNEIKGGGGIPRYGTEITVTIRSEADLGREVLKSDTAGLRIQELELELEEGSLDGVYTTIEGLLQKLHDRLKKANPFSIGDSAIKQHLTNDTGNEFSDPSPVHVNFKNFLQKLSDMRVGKMFPFTLVIADPLSNSFVGPIPEDAVALSLQAERDGHNKCYEEYVDPGMAIHEFERTHEQNEILGLNDIKTENYNDEAQISTYYGTDQMEELPDRIKRIDVRGPDHPHAVGKAPVEGDTTIMGPGSLNFAVPSIGLRGVKITDEQGKKQQQSITTSLSETNTVTTYEVSPLQKELIRFEMDDENFITSDVFGGSKDGMVYKNGARGLGYYTDKSFVNRTT